MVMNVQFWQRGNDESNLLTVEKRIRYQHAARKRCSMNGALKGLSSESHVLYVETAEGDTVQKIWISQKAVMESILLHTEY